VEDLLRQIRQLADAGRGIVLITHKLREVLGVSDAVTVLRHGKTVMTTSSGAASEEQLITAMLGESVRGAITRPSVSVNPAEAPALISAEALTIVDDRGVARVRDATFAVAGGEIVGVAAVAGSGHRELLRAVAGRQSVASGVLRRPAAVGFIPDDRHREALILDMSLTENYALRGAGQRRGRVPWARLAAATAAVIADYDVRAEDPRTPARTLSGGNQQKFVVARELVGFPPALVADNPTRGLDVRATQEIHRRLLGARERGVAVLLHSADIDEVLALADRVLVVHAGTVREAPVDRDAVGRAMLGAV
jgi:simple sugar transport system ATP-binding protein